jgi:hypothetical protein
MSKTKGKKTSRRNQKVYRMKGCAKKTRKNHLGGSPDAPLAYTGQSTPSQSNPFLAYTGKGGANCGISNAGNIPQNINAANPALPNTGAPILPTGTPIWNQASTQLGGSCGGTCSLTSSPTTPLMTGGGCGCSSSLMSGGGKRRGGCGPGCAMGFMVAGARHRVGCKCSKCKKRNMKGGNAGIPYPDGLVGSPFTPGNIGGWPGVDGISGGRNYSAQNMYLQDPQTAMKDTGNPPFLGGRRRKQKGGTFSNFMGQDLINLGRQFQFGLGSAYNALAGYASPVNPMPWKDQFPNKTPLNPSAL